MVPDILSKLREERMKIRQAYAKHNSGFCSCCAVGVSSNKTGEIFETKAFE